MLSTELVSSPRVFVLIAAYDKSYISALDIPAKVILLHSNKILTLDDAEITFDEIATFVIGALSFSAHGKSELNELVDGWAARTGAQGPKLIDVNTYVDPQEVLAVALRNITQLYHAKIGQLITHNARLLRQMVNLRIAQEETLSTLEATEHFLITSIDKRRWQVQSYEPFTQNQTAPFKISSGIKLCQLLAVSSMGLSDVSFMITEQNIPTTGNLIATLLFVESDEVAAQWILPAADLSAGWQRLSLIRALGQDEQSLHLQLEWQGAGHILVSASAHHPDKDYCAKTQTETHTRLLAHQVWKYAAGCPAPVPENSHWIGGPIPKRYYIEPVRLENAISANTNVEALQYFPNLEALQVHPFEGAVSAARIVRCVPESTRQINATVGGRAENGPKVEYALAVAPLHPVRELGDLIMDCEHNDCISDWLPMRGDTEGQLILNLKNPSQSICDLYLLTRLAPGAKQQRAWATFTNIWLSC